MIINQHNELLWEFGRLPSEYQEVEYIQKNAIGPYIDLGIYYEHGCVYKIGYEVVNTNVNYYLFGIRGTATKKNRCMATHGDYVTRFCVFAPKADIDNFIECYSDELISDTEYEIEVIQKSGSLLIVNNITTGYTGSSSATIEDISITEHTLPLFAQYYSTKIRDNISNACKIYYFKYYDSNDVLVRDMVPCYRKSDGEIGMYDLVSKTFFTNVGSGSFIKGDDVN